MTVLYGTWFWCCCGSVFLNNHVKVEVKLNWTWTEIEIKVHVLNQFCFFTSNLRATSVQNCFPDQFEVKLKNWANVWKRWRPALEPRFDFVSVRQFSVQFCFPLWTVIWLNWNQFRLEALVLFSISIQFVLFLNSILNWNWTQSSCFESVYFFYEPIVEQLQFKFVSQTYLKWNLKNGANFSWNTGTARQCGQPRPASWRPCGKGSAGASHLSRDAQAPAETNSASSCCPALRLWRPALEPRFGIVSVKLLVFSFQFNFVFFLNWTFIELKFIWPWSPICVFNFNSICSVFEFNFELKLNSKFLFWISCFFYEQSSSNFSSNLFPRPIWSEIEKLS